MPASEFDDTGHFKPDPFSGLMVTLVSVLVLAELAWVVALAVRS